MGRLRSLFFVLGFLLSVSASSKDELVMALNHYPPWQISDGETPEGIDVEIIQALAKRLSLTAKFVKCPGPRCLEMIRGGYADIITGLYKTPERMEYMSFIAAPYLRPPPHVFYVLKEDGPIIDVYEDLKSIERIGVLADTSYFPRFDNDSALRKLLVVDSSQLLNLLEIGRITTFIGVEPLSDYLIITEGAQDSVVKSRLRVTSGQGSYLALSKRSPHAANISAFNAALADMLEVGEIQKIETDFFQKLSMKNKN